jgi:hypothetical protein
MKSHLRFKQTCTQLAAAAFIATGMNTVYAAVTIPNSFTAGSPAVASQVNDNFTAVANQMPAVKTVETGGGTAISSTTAAMMQINVTTPGAGSVVVYASGTVYLNVSSASGQLIRAKVSETSADTTETPGIQFIRSPSITSTGAAHAFPFSIVKVFPATAGAHTYYLNMWHQVGSATGAAQIDDTTLTAVFIPNALP